MLALRFVHGGQLYFYTLLKRKYGFDCVCQKCEKCLKMTIKSLDFAQNKAIFVAEVLLFYTTH